MIDTSRHLNIKVACLVLQVLKYYRKPGRETETGNRILDDLEGDSLLELYPQAAHFNPLQNIPRAQLV